MTVWTPPDHVEPDTGWAVSDINEQVIDNLQFLHDGFPFIVTECQDLSQQLVPGGTNIAFGVPVIPHELATIPGLTYRSASTSGNIDVGVYSDDGNGTSASKLKTSGSTAMPAGATAHTINFTAPQTLDPYTKYWFVVALSASGARILGTDGPYTLLCKKMTSAFPLPTTFTFGATLDVAPCLVGIAS